MSFRIRAGSERGTWQLAAGTADKIVMHIEFHEIKPQRTLFIVESPWNQTLNHWLNQRLNQQLDQRLNHS